MKSSNSPAVARPISLAEYRQKRRPLRNVNKEFRARMSPLNRFALLITQRVGTIGFFLLILTWTVLWLGWNLLAPAPYRFDPPMGFVLWLFISNLIQILLMPLIMVGQNLQGQRSEARAENDLEVNVRAEGEIEVILHHLEYQNSLLMALMEKAGIRIEDIASAVKHEE